MNYVFWLLVAGLILSSSSTVNAAVMPSPTKLVHHVETGVIRATCSAVGPAYDITLSGKARATIYTSLDKVEQTGGVVIIPAELGPPKAGEASITKCDSEGVRCKQKGGIVTITTIEEDSIVGVVQISLAGWGRDYSGNEAHMFRAEYDRSYKPDCQ